MKSPIKETPNPDGLALYIKGGGFGVDLRGKNAVCKTGSSWICKKHLGRAYAAADWFKPARARWTCFRGLVLVSSCGLRTGRPGISGFKLITRLHKHAASSWEW